MSSSDNYPSLIICIGAWSFSLTSWGKVSPKRMLACILLRFLNLAQSTRIRSTNSHKLLTGGPATHSSLRSSSILQVWWAKVKPNFGPLHVPKMVELWFLPFLDWMPSSTCLVWNCSHRTWNSTCFWINSKKVGTKLETNLHHLRHMSGINSFSLAHRTCKSLSSSCVWESINFKVHQIHTDVISRAIRPKY